MIATDSTTSTTTIAEAPHTRRALVGLNARTLEYAGLGLTILLSAWLNLWNLAQNGYSNLYYATAVQSMTQSWHNFFFASYDAGGFITVDKPPAALWIQAISAKIFGFSSLSLLLPEALAGVASVALVYFLVRRLFGPLAGFVSALAMALTPIAVAMQRTNGVDTWLMFALILAAWAITLATEQGKFKWLALSMVLVGVAFNIKMLAAFIILPTFYLLYLLAAPVGWPKRLLHLAMASVVVFGVALSWPLAVDLTPAEQRPWVGGSQTNSVLDLTLNYNGLDRVAIDEGAGGGFGRGFRPPQGNFNGNNGNNLQFQPGAPNFGNNQPLPPGGNQMPPNFNGGRGPGGPGGPGGMFGAGFAGPLRLFFGGELAEQWSWLFPLATFGLVTALLALRRKWPLEPRGQAILLWVGWLVSYAVVFSMAEGIFHSYYLIMLAPAVAALVGIGVEALWSAYRNGGWQAWLLPVALLTTAFWQMVVLSAYPQWSVWLVPITLGVSLLTVVPLAGVRLLDGQVWRRVAPGLVSAGLVALFIAPLVWSVTPVLASPNNASLPAAGPNALSDNSSTWTRLNSSSDLASFLGENRDGYFYLVAVNNSQQASSIALATGEPALAMGGFMGSDPAMSVERLQQMISDKQVRFIMLGGGMGPMGGNSGVSQWVQANCAEVDSSLYGGQSGIGSMGGPGFMGGDQQLYSCAAR